MATDEVDVGPEMRAPELYQRLDPGLQLPVHRTRPLIPNPQRPSQFSIWHLFLIYLSSAYSLHQRKIAFIMVTFNVFSASLRSEEHTSELQSQSNLVCRLLLE